MSLLFLPGSDLKSPTAPCIIHPFSFFPTCFVWSLSSTHTMFVLTEHSEDKLDGYWVIRSCLRCRIGEERGYGSHHSPCLLEWCQHLSATGTLPWLSESSPPDVLDIVTCRCRALSLTLFPPILRCLWHSHLWNYSHISNHNNFVVMLRLKKPKLEPTCICNRCASVPLFQASLCFLERSAFCSEWHWNSPSQPQLGP